MNHPSRTRSALVFLLLALLLTGCRASPVATASPYPERRTITTPPGGILTVEVGAITGEVEIWLRGDRVGIRYAGARDVHTVVGARRGRSLGEVADILTRDVGTDGSGNPVAATLG